MKSSADKVQRDNDLGIQHTYRHGCLLSTLLRNRGGANSFNIPVCRTVAYVAQDAMDGGLYDYSAKNGDSKT
jgi:hypothetical protein